MNVKERVRRMMTGGGDANTAAFATGFVLIVMLIIAVIALFLDIVYITMVWDGLPKGFLQIVAAGGAVLVSPVVILILLAKLFYFRSGGQLIFSYFAFAVDLAFAGLNTYCAFQIAWHDENAFVVGWRSLSTIMPCAILMLLSILLILDPNAKRRNKERDHTEKERDLELRFQHEENARKMALRELQAEFEATKQEAAIEVRAEALEEYKRMLREELLNDQTRAVLREGARRLGETAIYDLTGLSRPSGHTSISPASSSPRLEPPKQPSAPQPSFADELADSVIPAAKSPITEDLSPLPVAPERSKNGAH